MNGPLILIVEDEPQMLRFMRASLGSHGYRLLEAGTAQEATQLATTHAPELILMDLGLPDMDGLELTKQMREWTRTPIIVISARGREDDKVLALDAGADDYLTKPFGINELLARIRVALRHVREAASNVSDPVLVVRDLTLDLGKRQVHVGGKEVHLTPTEYKLLALLGQHRGKVLTHRQILKEVWGPAYANRSHYVRVHMAELRKKIEADPARPKLIVTEPGVGYRMRED
jgi:two-component system KDP operon response regulator KdpE